MYRIARSSAQLTACNPALFICKWYYLFIVVQRLAVAYKCVKAALSDQGMI
jgi:hypothetical protein